MSEDFDLQKANQFLTELGELTKKHGIKIGGCGCCGSPWLMNTIHVKKEGCRYHCDDDGDNLVWME